jgi:eukaryotic-like serine/threonine-protein kinase
MEVRKRHEDRWCDESSHICARIPGGAHNIAEDLIAQNRFEETRAIIEKLASKNPDSVDFAVERYILAFQGNDSSEMEKLVAAAAGKAPVADMLLEAASETASYSGSQAKARSLSQQAIAAAERTDNHERAAVYDAHTATNEAFLGNVEPAQQRAVSALRRSSGRQVQCGAALATAAVGDSSRTKLLSADLAKQFAEDTIINLSCLPMVSAELALTRNNPAVAIETLQAAAPYELSNVRFSKLLPAYVRGIAYLAAHRGPEATFEFQKIIDHRGIVSYSIIGALAHLQLGRAYAMQGDQAKARAAYQDFLTLWKDADPDIPVLIAAKAEYAKLQ